MAAESERALELCPAVSDGCRRRRGPRNAGGLQQPGRTVKQILSRDLWKDQSPDATSTLAQCNHAVLPISSPEEHDFVLFSNTKFVALCYSSRRRPLTIQVLSNSLSLGWMATLGNRKFGGRAVLDSGKALFIHSFIHWFIHSFIFPL